MRGEWPCLVGQLLPRRAPCYPPATATLLRSACPRRICPALGSTMRYGQQSTTPRYAAAELLCSAASHHAAHRAVMPGPAAAQPGLPACWAASSQLAAAPCMQAIAFLTQQCMGLGLGYVSGTGGGTRQHGQPLAGKPHPQSFVARVASRCLPHPGAATPSCTGLIASISSLDAPRSSPQASSSGACPAAVVRGSHPGRPPPTTAATACASVCWQVTLPPCRLVDSAQPGWAPGAVLHHRLPGRPPCPSLRCLSQDLAPTPAAQATSMCSSWCASTLTGCSSSLSAGSFTPGWMPRCWQGATCRGEEPSATHRAAAQAARSWLFDACCEVRACLPAAARHHGPV